MSSAFVLFHGGGQWLIRLGQKSILIYGNRGGLFFLHGENRRAVFRGNLFLHIGGLQFSSSASFSKRGR